MGDKIKFVFRVTLIHIATYIFCGIVFSTVFNYQELFKIGSTEYFMKEYLGSSTLVGPLLQCFRGLLFGLILLVIGRGLINGKNGWLKLWIVIAGIGIINTPGPGISSIEGLIYTTIPLEVHIKGSFEILTQTLLFSYFVCKKRKRNPFITKNKNALSAMIITGIGISLSGIFICLRNNLDIMLGIEDKYAFIIMFIAMIIVFSTTKWMEKEFSNFADFTWILVCYISNGVLSTAYNYITNSPFKSKETLMFGIIPTFIIWYVVKKKNK